MLFGRSDRSKAAAGRRQEPRQMAEKALAAVIQEAYVQWLRVLYHHAHHGRAQARRER
jgi:hypothetical protein